MLDKNDAVTIVSVAAIVVAGAVFAYWIRGARADEKENTENLIRCYAISQEDYSRAWDSMCEERAMEPGCSLMDGPYEEMQALLARSKEECRLFYWK